MSLELSSQLWKETKEFLHDNNDKKNAAEAFVTVLMEHFDITEIKQEFLFDKSIIDAIAEYTDVDDVDDMLDEDY